MRAEENMRILRIGKWPFYCKFEITNGQFAILTFPDVFIPEFGMVGDELLHQSDALGVIDDF